MLKPKDSKSKSNNFFRPDKYDSNDVLRVNTFLTTNRTDFSNNLIKSNSDSINSNHVTQREPNFDNWQQLRCYNKTIN